MGNGADLTFLFTDIEGSSQLWEQAPAAMKDAVARHEELIRNCVAGHAGRIVKTLGDGVYAVFPTADQAAAGAVASMRSLEREPWPDSAPIRVRMGMHTGPAERRGSDFYGPAVNRAARIANAAHAGQILASQSSADHLENSDSRVTLQAVGAIALRGIAEPEPVVQVVAQGLTKDFPPLRGTEVANNLPALVDSFVGGDEDRLRLLHDLSTNRLVTVTAIGGAGKTRLAIEAASRAMPRFPDGVWFVDLSQMSSSGNVPSSVAATLGITEYGATPLLDVVVEHLGETTTLLVLDNCEHVVDAAAEVAERIVSATSATHVLATSRRPLLVAGETVYFLSPLASREPDGTPGPATRLFVDRARAARRDFDPDFAQLETIAAICSHLDGIPLAIELAAAKMRAIDLATLLDRLGDRFRLLVGGSRTADERQRTLRGTIDWSYDLLLPEEQRAFVDLSVAAGGFTLSAAEAILEIEGDAFDPLDLVARLVDNSLLRSTDSMHELRFEMLESLRQYGEQHLADTNRKATVETAFAHHYAGCADGADELLKGPEQTRWHAAFAADEPNLLKAIDILAATDPSRALGMAAELGRFWYRKGATRVGHEVMKQVIAAGADESTEAKALALGWLGFFTDVRGERRRARELTAQALEMARHVDSPKAMAFALNGIGGYESDLGRRRSAADHWRESVAMLDRSGSPWVTAPLFNLGKVLTQLGDHAEAEAVANRLEAFADDHDDPWTRELATLLRGYVAHGRGSYADARSALDRAIAGFDRLGALFHAVEGRIVLSQIAEETGNVVAARREFAAAERQLADTAAFDHDEAHILRARMAIAGDDPDAAIRHLSDALRIITDTPNLHSSALVFHELARIADGDGDEVLALEMLAASESIRRADQETPSFAHAHEAAAIRDRSRAGTVATPPPATALDAIALMQRTLDGLASNRAGRPGPL